MERWKTKIVTAPATEPVSLDELKGHARIDLDDEDQNLRLAIRAARRLVEMITRRALITQTWDGWLDRFPYYRDQYPYREIGGTLAIPYPPLGSVTHVKYYNGDGVLTTLAVTTDYTVDANSEPGRVVPAYGSTWPTTRRIPNAVNVRWVAGYGATPGTVPEELRLAILQLVAYYYREREPVPMRPEGGVLPMHCLDLMSAYRVLEAV